MQSGNEPLLIILWVVGIAVSIGIAYFFTRWVFSIKRQLWNQKQQINLLVRIAKKLGVDENDEQLKAIIESNNNPSDENL